MGGVHGTFLWDESQRELGDWFVMGAHLFRTTDGGKKGMSQVKNRRKQSKREKQMDEGVQKKRDRQYGAHFKEQK